MKTTAAANMVPGQAVEVLCPYLGWIKNFTFSHIDTSAPLPHVVQEDCVMLRQERGEFAGMLVRFPVRHVRAV